jgi:hypothetical protein
MARREYTIDPIVVNKRIIHSVVIDSHYEENHGDHLDDQLILRLVSKLDGRLEAPEDRDEDFAYFVTLLELSSKQYRLVWLLEANSIYLGVLNAYRDDRKT